MPVRLYVWVYPDSLRNRLSVVLAVDLRNFEEDCSGRREVEEYVRDSADEEVLRREALLSTEIRERSSEMKG